jgi:hypothetical protein
MAWAIGTLAVVSSVVLHGVTATPFAKWYGTWARAEKAAEHEVLKERPDDPLAKNTGVGVGIAIALLVAGAAALIVIIVLGS